MIALLLSILGLLVMGIATAVIFGSDAATTSENEFRGALTVGMLIGVVPCLLLLLGSILLFRRKTAGRVILLLLSGLALVFSVLSTVLPLISGNGVAGEEATYVLIGGAVSAAAPLLILLLAVAPSTGRWIRAGRSGGYQQYPQY
ncbi:hypothetical protein ASD42_25340 [Nocardia sp. Root136]|nr:hypothetical protein ASD42_25340 [Nocardia sp. Root136]